MSDFDVIRAWKDPKYRRSLTDEQRASLPDNPAGAIELTDDELKSAGSLVVGAAAVPITTAPTCTAYTFLGWRACGCGIVTTAITCTEPSFAGFRACCPSVGAAPESPQISS